LRAPPGMGGERSTASVRVGGQPWQALRQRPSATDATRAAVAARRAAWFEDERGAGRRRLATDDLVVQDDDPAIEQFAHVDRQPGVGARATELHHARPEAHGVVAGDHAAVAAAEAEGEIARRPAPHRLAVGAWVPASCSSTDQWASLRTSRFRRSPYTAMGRPWAVNTSRNSVT